MIRFTVAETPVGKGRARTSPRGGRPYTPAKTRRYEALVRAACADAMRRHGQKPFDEPVHMTILIRLTPPKSAPKKKQAAMLAGEIAPISRPDTSNVAKAIEDAVNQIAYRDDALITRLTVERVFATHTGVDVEIESRDQARARELDRSEHLGGSGPAPAEAYLDAVDRLFTPRAQDGSAVGGAEDDR